MIQSAKVIGPNVSYEVYSRQATGVGRGHSDFVMSRSELMEVALNPARWRAGMDGDDDSTTATEWGSLIDVLAMTPDRFDERYAVAPAEYADEKTGKLKPWNWNANVCKEWRALQGELKVIKSEMLDKAKAAVATLRADADVTDLFNCSAKQVMIVGEWKDKATGRLIPIRSLLDLVPDKNHPTFGKWLADFKTARNGNPDIWSRVVDDGGYDIQAALSTDLYVAATKEDRTDWVFPVQENVKPYHVVKPMPALTTEFLAYGRAKYAIALREYAQCLATNKWPSYSTGNRVVIGPTQLIGPDSLWKYRETGGQFTSRMEYQPEPRPEPRPEPEYFDVGH